MLQIVKVEKVEHKPVAALVDPVSGKTPRVVVRKLSDIPGTSVSGFVEVVSNSLLVVVTYYTNNYQF